MGDLTKLVRDRPFWGPLDIKTAIID